MGMEIHFLSYLNRSGSTLLARKLNEFKDISVGIELKQKPSVVKSFCAESGDELDYWLDQVYLDKKFQSWQIDRNELADNLAKQGYPIYFNHFLKHALWQYFKNDGSKILIHKGKQHIGQLDKAEKLYPGSKFIFIDRDPRGIYNSQKRSLDSTTKKIMQNDIIKFVIGYKHIQQRLKYYSHSKKHNHKLLIIRYENLINRENEELKKVINFFNVTDTKCDESNYFEKIPEGQKHLHKNLDKPNKKSRTIAWKKELTDDEINLLNYVLKRELQENNYRIEGEHNLSKLLKNKRIRIKIVKIYILFYPKFLIKKFLLLLKMKKIY